MRKNMKVGTNLGGLIRDAARRTIKAPVYVDRTAEQRAGLARAYGRIGASRRWGFLLAGCTQQDIADALLATLQSPVCRAVRP